MAYLTEAHPFSPTSSDQRLPQRRYILLLSSPRLLHASTRMGTGKKHPVLPLLKAARDVASLDRCLKSEGLVLAFGQCASSGCCGRLSIGTRDAIYNNSAALRYPRLHESPARTCVRSNRVASLGCVARQPLRHRLRLPRQAWARRPLAAGRVVAPAVCVCVLRPRRGHAARRDAVDLLQAAQLARCPAGPPRLPRHVGPPVHVQPLRCGQGRPCRRAVRRRPAKHRRRWRWAVERLEDTGRGPRQRLPERKAWSWLLWRRQERNLRVARLPASRTLVAARTDHS